METEKPEEPWDNILYHGTSICSAINILETKQFYGKNGTASNHANLSMTRRGTRAYKHKREVILKFRWTGKDAQISYRKFCEDFALIEDIEDRNFEIKCYHITEEELPEKRYFQTSVLAGSSLQYIGFEEGTSSHGDELDKDGLILLNQLSDKVNGCTIDVISGRRQHFYDDHYRKKERGLFYKLFLFIQQKLFIRS